MSAQDYFKGKMIAVIGLGNNGEMVEDIKYLIKAGALVSLYDLKSEARLKSHIVFLRSVGLANYVCGSVPAEDLLDMDLIILSHEYPRDSTFLKNVLERNRIINLAKPETFEKREKTIPVEYPETLFFKRSPPVVVVGVMGEYGKSTLVSVLAPMLAMVCAATEGQDFFLIDPETGEGAVSVLKKVKSGDIVLVRMGGRIMRELHDIRISPQVAVFTSIPPEDSYHESPFEILDHQTYNNFIIASDEIIDQTRTLKAQRKAKMLRTKTSVIPEGWRFGSRRTQDREIAALALQTARLFKVEDEMARDVLENWKPVKGRLELVKKIKGVEYYNDSASIWPSATVRALQTLSGNKDSVLIFGGAKNGGDCRILHSIMPRFVHTLILLPGSGTMHERAEIMKIQDVNIHSVPSIEEAVRLAAEKAVTNNKVIFSPGFEAAGLDNTRKERGERFVRAVRGL